MFPWDWWFSGRRRINLSIASDTSDYDAFVSAGSPADPVDVYLTIDAGVTVGATTNGPNFGAIACNGFQVGSRVTITMNGTAIFGSGGDAGSATATNGANGGSGGSCIVYDFDGDLILAGNSGQISAGGGGGGGGGTAVDSGGQEVGGGGGGGGRGYTHANNGILGTGYDGSNPPGTAGTDGTVGNQAWAGAGGAGGSGGGDLGGSGGNGGLYAVAGDSGTASTGGDLSNGTGGSGGAAGRAVRNTGSGVTTNGYGGTVDGTVE